MYYISRNTCPPPRSTLSPYTTLFRSDVVKEVIQPQVPLRLPCYDFTPVMNHTVVTALPKVKLATSGAIHSHGVVHRSEEHTSELQSRENLVCRLLLAKKKTPYNYIIN